ncbi:MAG: hypothetical protein ABI835_13275 [Chloroflexota bacterium]
MKKIALAALLFAAILVGVSSSAAQTTTTTATPAATTTGPSNSTEGLLVVCADSAVLNFSGVSLVGFDVFYQIFSGSSGSGTALTNLRQVPVAGEYAVSDTVSYNSGVTVAAAGQASAKVDVARESDPTNIDYSFVLTDAQDGCNTPTNTLASAVDTGADSSGSSASAAPGTAGTTTSIFAPNGGLLNASLQPEATVVVGARPSDRFRSDTPGLIFAECDVFPLAEPGIIYDTDTITIFWSWFTKTREQMDQHLANALYNVELNTANLPMTTLSEPVLRSGNTWVFYTATVGNLRPGHYEVGYLLEWANPVNDGYADYGPGTTNPRQSGICNFDVLHNNDGVNIPFTGMYFPTNFAVHNIEPTDQP